jgi:hypothetical protein
MHFAPHNSAAAKGAPTIWVGTVDGQQVGVITDPPGSAIGGVAMTADSVVRRGFEFGFVRCRGVTQDR